jgi:hypothetical protein
MPVSDSPLLARISSSLGFGKEIIVQISEIDLGI